jgi:tetratricopeptide (TPR) repeat protein
MSAVSCDSEKKTWLTNLLSAEKSEFRSGDIPEERIENLKKGISFYEGEVERTIKASKQIGIYYRMLALEYMSLEMYNEALKSLEQAVTYFPTSPLLYYYAAVSAAQMINAVMDSEDAGFYLNKAEEFYLRAIELDPRHSQALYGLSVLYIFELNRPLDAEPLLERLISTSRVNYDAMFLLARVKILKGEIEDAVELYSKIEEGASDEEVKRKAIDNRRQLLGGFADG